VKKIESISVKGEFWLQFKTHLFSLWVKGMNKSIHYTLAFNASSDFINLHVTKNVKAEKSKKVRICTFNKQNLEVNSEFLAIEFMNQLLIRIEDPTQLEGEVYVSFEELKEKSLMDEMETKLLDNFRRISKVKQKTRIKINGEYLDALESTVKDESLQNHLLENNKDFDSNSNRKIDGGMLFNENGDITGVIKIEDFWFKLDLLTPRELLVRLIGQQNTNDLIEYTKSAYSKLVNSHDYSWIGDFEKPMNFVFNDRKDL